MRNFLKNFIPLLPVILNWCTSINGNFTICDLALICGIRNDTKVTAVPQQCTALAVSSGNTNNILAVENKKGSLPLLIIMREIGFGALDKLVLQDFNELYKDFMHIQFDFMAFDNTYKFLAYEEDTNNLTQYLGIFINKTRLIFPDKKFGFIIGHDVNSMENKFNLEKLCESSDFFLLESTGYRDCNYHTHQKDMNDLATKDDILESLTNLKEKGVILNKVIYTIELKIESKIVLDEEDMDYSYLCNNKFSDDRKYCFSLLQSIFDKARLHMTEHTAGIYINGIDFDDIEGKCGCITKYDKSACWRGLKTIAGASQEDVNDISFYNCAEGAFPVIQ